MIFVSQKLEVSYLLEVSPKLELDTTGSQTEFRLSVCYTAQLKLTRKHRSGPIW